MKNVSWASGTSFPSGNSSWSSGDGGLRVWGGYNDMNDKTLSSDISFADLYSGGYVIELFTTADGKWKDDKVQQRAKERLGNLGDCVVGALAAAGLDKNILERAKTSVVNTWINNGTTFYDDLANKGCNKADQRENGDSVYNKLAKETTGAGIYEGEDTKGNNQRVYMVNFRAFVDTILVMYDKMVG